MCLKKIWHQMLKLSLTADEEINALRILQIGQIRICFRHVLLLFFLFKKFCVRFFFFENCLERAPSSYGNLSVGHKITHLAYLSGVVC